MSYSVLSLGAGVQSSTLALMAALGEIPAPHLAVFADTGWEPAAVYRHLDWLETQLTFPIVRVSAGNIRHDLMRFGKGNRWASIPAFVRNEKGSAAMIRRQCTTEYKVVPIRQAVRDALRIPRRGRTRKGVRVEMLLGISTDEAQRMKPSRVAFIENRWPLIDLGMSRADCLAWCADRGFPEPPKSSCVGCPFHTDAQWANLTPAELTDAAIVDATIRRGVTQGELYLHRSLVPLAEIEFRPGPGPDPFGNECEGLCGT